MGEVVPIQPKSEYENRSKAQTRRRKDEDRRKTRTVLRKDLDKVMDDVDLLKRMYAEEMMERYRRDEKSS